MEAELSTIALIIPSFIAGLFTFLAPCTLPLVPGYIGFISGVPKGELENEETAANARRRIIKNGLFFVLGFSIVFIVLGTLVGFLGTQLGFLRVWLSRIGGLLVILFGLFMIGLIKIPALSKEHKFKLPKFIQVGHPTSSLMMGAAFAVGWSPCLGPVLGSILALAGSTATALQGALLLAVFSLGLAVPFILVAYGFTKASAVIKNMTPYLRVISIIGGVFIVLLGILLFTNNLTLLISWGYQLLSILGLENYEAFLTNYL